MNENVIHLNNMPFNAIESTLSSLQTKIKNINNNSYADMLQAAKEQIANSETKTTADMTLDEYKDYINHKLNTMKRDLTRCQDDVTVIISDAGFEAMKTDSEYETWVLDVVQQNLSYPNYFYGIVKNSANISVHEFGANKEEYRCQVYSANRDDNLPVNNETEDFWTLRKKRMKKILEMEQEIFENFYQLQKLSEHKAEVKSAQMKAEGLVDTSNPMPIITGIPAKFLLSMLTADS